VSNNYLQHPIPEMVQACSLNQKVSEQASCLFQLEDCLTLGLFINA